MNNYLKIIYTDIRRYKVRLVTRKMRCPHDKKMHRDEEKLEGDKKPGVLYESSINGGVFLFENSRCSCGWIVKKQWP